MAKKKIDKVFKKGDKVWANQFLHWDKGVVVEALDDGSYFVKIKKPGVERKTSKELEKRTGGFGWKRF